MNNNFSIKKDNSHSWGSFTEYQFNEKIVLRNILINKGYKTSLHRHKFLDEVYIIMSGSVLVHHGDSISNLNREELTHGDFMFIKKKEWHSVDCRKMQSNCSYIEIVIFKNKIDLSDIEKSILADEPLDF